MAQLTSAQKTTIRTDMLGASNASIAAFISGGDWASVADYYNGAHPTTKVWMEDASVDAIRGLINWARLTPAFPLPANDTGASLWTARSASCRGKQHNLDMMLRTTTGTVPAHIKQFRDGLQDALTNLPSAVDGSNQNAGWGGAGGVEQVALMRAGTRLEVLFSTADSGANKSTLYGYVLAPREALAVWSNT